MRISSSHLAAYAVQFLEQPVVATRTQTPNPAQSFQPSSAFDSSSTEGLRPRSASQHRPRPSLADLPRTTTLRARSQDQVHTLSMLRMHRSRNMPYALEDLPALRKHLLDSPQGSQSWSIGQRLEKLQSQWSAQQFGAETFVAQAKTLIDDIYDRREDFAESAHFSIAMDDVGLQYQKFKNDPMNAKSIWHAMDQLEQQQEWRVTHQFIASIENDLRGYRDYRVDLQHWQSHAYTQLHELRYEAQHLDHAILNTQKVLSQSRRLSQDADAITSADNRHAVVQLEAKAASQLDQHTKLRHQLMTSQLKQAEELRQTKSACLRMDQLVQHQEQKLREYQQQLKNYQSWSE